MHLLGFHHLTAVTADAPGNHDFYTRVLGMRLVKKTVNQDDVTAYHLFYADGAGHPGTDLTFFDWPVDRARRGTRSVTRTGLRVVDAAALGFWHERFTELEVPHGPPQDVDGRLCLEFEDPEGQCLSLVAAGEASATDFLPWSRSPVPAAFQIRGLGPITISVPDIGPTERFLTGVLGMSRIRTYERAGNSDGVVQVYSMGEGGPAAELHVRVEPGRAVARLGAGGVHHVAFRIPDGDYDAWTERLRAQGVRSSGPVDRFWFRSLYVREPGGVLFEIATDGPGFTADEPLTALGEKLVLPPFLEAQRPTIEAGLQRI
ncbi:ring-cleaving dioxygenase [Roseomonas gilardii]|uniref:Ring-cleaving dioxygenase n=1 Tax=Roseomonas gilardii TaxID=257708 RepID=A0ABU3MIP6_9PROT|nr:ring-cleaving dioxygenase [Roseomonas gilardii]MDT8332878.1 ring-cleaving dioxygenase [Roseomonas gilardii]